MSRVVAIVQSRYGSSRLPGKAMIALAGRPMLAHVLERASAIKGVSEVVLATSLAEADSVLATLAAGLGYRCYRGSEHDVLSRFVEAADMFRAEIIMRLTGDCPFLAPAICEAVLGAALADRSLGYVSNDTTCSGFPDGVDCEIFPRVSLGYADRAGGSASDREHVTPLMRRYLSCRTVRSATDWPRVKLSVDCQDDLAVAKRLVGRIQRGDFSLTATMAAYDGGIL